MNAELICLVIGGVIAGLVQLFKQWIFVQKYPKIVAAILSIVASVVSSLTYGDLDWSKIALCTVGQFAAAVATYEVVKTAGSKP